MLEGYDVERINHVTTSRTGLLTQSPPPFLSLPVFPIIWWWEGGVDSRGAETRKNHANKVKKGKKYMRLRNHSSLVFSFIYFPGADRCAWMSSTKPGVQCLVSFGGTCCCVHSTFIGLDHGVPWTNPSRPLYHFILVLSIHFWWM